MRVVVLIACLTAPAVASAQTSAAGLQNQLALDAARAQQQQLSVGVQLQGLQAEQSRLQTQQALGQLQANRLPSPSVTTEYPGRSGVIRPGQRSTVPPAPTPSTPVPADAATRGDLPL